MKKLNLRKTTTFLKGMLLLLGASFLLSACGGTVSSEESPPAVTHVTDRETETPDRREETPSEEQGSSGETEETDETKGAEKPFEYTPGEASVKLAFDSPDWREALTEEEKDVLRAYILLRGSMISDPLNTMNTLYASGLRLSSEIRETVQDRSFACLAFIYRVLADMEEVDVTAEVQRVSREDGTLAIVLDEVTTVRYRYKGHKAADRMQWAIPHEIILSGEDRPEIMSDRYDEDKILPFSREEKEAALDQAYQAYLYDHPVTDEMLRKAEEGIREYLEYRLRTAIQSGTYGLEGFTEADVPELLRGAMISYDPLLSEKWVVTGLLEQPDRLPFGQYRAVFSVTFDLTYKDPKSGEKAQPFAPRFNRVFLVPEQGPWEQLDIHDHYHFD